MTTDEIKEIIKSGTKKYLLTLSNGEKKVVRLFTTYDGYPCIIHKGKKLWGHKLNWSGLHETANWVSLKPCEKKEIDYVKRIIKRAKDASKMLEKSGLWQDIKKEIDDFLNLPMRDIEMFVKDATYDFYNNVYQEVGKPNSKYPWLHSYQVFGSFLSDRCWKSINHKSWNREEMKNSITEHINNKQNYSYAWRNGYDNSIELNFDCDDHYRGWYSEEFMGCGNGHYYLLFDATHAIFYEDD